MTQGYRWNLYIAKVWNTISGIHVSIFSRSASLCRGLWAVTQSTRLLDRLPGCFRQLLSAAMFQAVWSSSCLGHLRCGQVFVNLEEGQRLSFWNFVSPQWIGIAQDFCRRRHTLNANQQCRICIYCIYVIKCYIYIQLYTYILFNWDIYYDNILWYTHIDII